MKIIVDGAIYYNSRVAGGISRLFSEIMPRICNHDEDIYFQILMNKKSLQPLLQHAHISYRNTYKIEPFLRPWRFWKSRLDYAKNEYNSIMIGDTRNKIWHSTYYTLPNRWKGAVVVTAYDLIRELYKETYYTDVSNMQFRKMMQNAVVQSDKIISISNTTKDDLQKIYGVAGEKIQVIPLGYSDAFKHMPSQSYFDKPFILYVGNRRRYKNFMVLLKSFSVWAKNNDVDLVVVGSEWSDEEVKDISELNVFEKVKLLRHADDSVLCDLYNNAMAFVYPSMYEGFGIPLLEAMSCGCPIVASRIRSTLEVANNIPIYHEPGNGEELLANLEQVYCEPRPSSRVLLGLEHVKQYSWERTARQTAQLYRDIIL